MTNTRTTTVPFELHLPVEGLKVTGEAAREAPPEMIELGFDIHGMGSTAAFALQDCAIRMMQIGQALTSLGIAQTDLQAGPMSVRAIPMPAASLSSYTGLRPQLHPGFSSMGSVVPFTPAHPQTHSPYGFGVTSSVKVSVRDTARLAEVVDAVMASGANLLASFRFLLHDERILRRTLLEEAVREAREKAEVLAVAVGRSVGKPTSIEEDFRVYQPYPVYADGLSHYPAVMPPPFPANITRYPFTVGQLTFHASVSVTYQLQ